MSSRKFSLEAYFLIKARSETPTYRFNSVGHCSKCGPHRLADQFQVVEAADRGQNMGGVGALLAARLDQAALAQVLQHNLEQVLIVFSGKQARSELTENGKVKARILKF